VINTQLNNLSAAMPASNSTPASTLIQLVSAGDSTTVADSVTVTPGVEGVWGAQNWGAFQWVS